MASPWAETFDKPDPRRMTVLGTCHFVSVALAIRYYRNHGYRDIIGEIDRKLAEGEIHIGKPVISDGEELVLLDNGQRYGIKMGL
jgi:hypothetical protein